jgi:hypothetical protein
MHPILIVLITRSMVTSLLYLIVQLVKIIEMGSIDICALFEISCITCSRRLVLVLPIPGYEWQTSGCLSNATYQLRNHDELMS